MPQTTTSVSSQNALNQTAVRIGTLIGTAVNIGRGVQRQLRSAPNNVVPIRERLREEGKEVRRGAFGTANQWRQMAQARMQQARERTAQYVRENPLHVIAAAAGAAFCLGAALRIWRSGLD